MLNKYPPTLRQQDRSHLSRLRRGNCPHGGAGSRKRHIARALVGLCHSIGLEVTAEGIECSEQLTLLADLTPIYLQGYLLARPVSADKLLPVMAGLPNHMASLLPPSLPKSADSDAPADDHTVMNQQVLYG